MYSQSELATFRHASSNVTLNYNTLLPTFSGKKKSNATRQIRSKSNTSTRKHKHKDPCANQVVPVKENSCHASASPPNEHTCNTTRQIVKLPTFRPLSRCHDIEAKNPTRKNPNAFFFLTNLSIFSLKKIVY